MTSDGAFSSTGTTTARCGFDLASPAAQCVFAVVDRFSGAPFCQGNRSHLPDLLDLSRADITSRKPGRRQQGLGNIDTLSQRVSQIRAEDAVIPPLPSGIGDAIMDKFRMPPSKLIGDSARALAKIDAGEIEPRMESEYSSADRRTDDREPCRSAAPVL